MVLPFVLCKGAFFGIGGKNCCPRPLSSMGKKLQTTGSHGGGWETEPAQLHLDSGAPRCIRDCGQLLCLLQGSEGGSPALLLEMIDSSEKGQKMEQQHPPSQNPAALGPKLLGHRFWPKEESIPHASHSKMRFSAPGGGGGELCHKPIDITSSTLLSFTGGEEGGRERPEETDVIRTRITHTACPLAFFPAAPLCFRYQAVCIETRLLEKPHFKLGQLSSPSNRN